MNKSLTNSKGVTLIALVVTVIVLIILAAVTINMLIGTNGILTRAKEGADNYTKAEAEERDALGNLLSEMDEKTAGSGENPGGEDTIADKFNDDDTGEIKTGDYVLYSPTPVTLTNSSDIIQNLGNYSGYTGTAYNKVDSTTNQITQETALKWRVLDKTASGEIRLISEEPTSSLIYLSGAKGYNNAVKLIDDFCKELYSNTNLASNVQSLKIEDIENKMNLATWNYHDYVGSYQYGTYGAKLETSKNYPKIFYDEEGQQVNEATHGSLGLSEQSDYISEGAITTTTSITPKQTYWNRAASSFTNANFTNAKHYEMFIKKDETTNYSTYWLASRCVNLNSTNANFYVRYVDSGYVSANGLYNSGDIANYNYYRVRPVVTLKSSVKVTGGDATSGWIIE